MINIAIVEDEDFSAGALKDFLARYEKEENVKFDVRRYVSADEFLRDYTPYFAVAFFDIQMPGTNGMDAAFALREKDKNISLIFITSMTQYAVRGYEVDAVSYILKPVNYYELAMKLKKALALYFSKEKKSIEIKLPNGMYEISSDKLMYVEISGHRLVYRMTDDEVKLSGTLSEVEKQLCGEGFLRCNSCYLVNPSHIKKIDGYDIYIGDTVLRISRPRYKSFMSDFIAATVGRKRV